MDEIVSYIVRAMVETALNEPAIQELLREIETVMGCLILIPSLLICFLGYKLLKLIITINGGFIGGILGAIGGAVIMKGLSCGPWIIVVCILGGILIGGFLAFKLYRLGIFLQFFFYGTLTSAILLALLNLREPAILLAVSAAIGIAIGVLAVVLNKSFIIVGSAIIGGFNAASASGMIAPVIAKEEGIEFLIGLVLAILGAVVQFLLEKKKEVAGQVPITGGGTIVRCTNCGAEIEEDSKFCPSCGNSVNYFEIKRMKEKSGFLLGGFFIALVLGTIFICVLNSEGKRWKEGEVYKFDQYMQKIEDEYWDEVGRIYGFYINPEPGLGRMGYNYDNGYYYEDPDTHEMKLTPQAEKRLEELEEQYEADINKHFVLDNGEFMREKTGFFVACISIILISVLASIVLLVLWIRLRVELKKKCKENGNEDKKTQSISDEVRSGIGADLCSETTDTGEQLDSPLPKAQEVLFCPNCGSRLDSDSVFCMSCGTKIE